MHTPIDLTSAPNIETTKKCPDLEIFSETDRWTLLAASKVIRFRKGQYIWHDQDNATAVYVVLTGLVQLFGINSKGVMNTNLFVGEPHMFGELELFAQKARCNHAKVLSDSSILEIKKDAFLDLIENNTLYSNWWLKKISSLTFSYSKAKAHFKGEQPFKKVLAGLGFVMDSMGSHGGITKDSNNRQIHLNISQEYFSSFIGLSRQVANRALRELEGRGLVNLSYSSITILNRESIIRLLMDNHY